MRRPPSLVSESEQAVLQALRRLMAGRTTIVVAHRLSTIRRAPVVDRGVFAVRGTHEELMEAVGVYSRFWIRY
jgi:ABC-type multidrug transport system fused ATPase/permease subunit